MSLTSALSIATSGLSATQYEMSVASQNIANASTAGYATETANISSSTAAGTGTGVRVGLTGRVVDQALQASLYGSNASVAGLTTLSNGLAPITALQGSTSADSGSSDTLADDVGNLQSSLTTLETDPSSASGQQAVLSAAGTVATAISSTANAYQDARQGAQDAIVSDVDQINTSLSQIGSLSDQIVSLQSRGISTADLENQRATAMSTLSSLVSVNFTETSTGDMLVTTTSGLSLPTHQQSGPLSASDATLDATSTYPDDTALAVTLDGTDVTASLSGATSGSLGANIALRDTVLPGMQTQLDQFAQNLTSTLADAGVPLFASGGSTASGDTGYSADIEVNPTVSADPGLIQSGTSSGSNTTDTSDTSVIAALVDALNGSGGTSLSGQAASLTASQATTINNFATQLTNETDVQTALSTKVASVSGVSVDQQMSDIVALQNAYSANAKVVSAVQTMFTALLNAIGS